MNLKVINLIDSLHHVNFGVWNAAISTATLLREDHRIDSEVWTRGPQEIPESVYDRVETVRMFDNTNSLVSFVTKLQQNSKGLDPGFVIASHGAWSFPTRWGERLSRFGLPWVYTPQGMLEPWSLSQKRIRKAIYFRWTEMPACRSSSAIRAVSIPERENLVKLFGESKLVHIPNGIPALDPVTKDVGERRTFLFMGRLHHKKGVLPLVRAFRHLLQSENHAIRLLVVGPDDGELAAVKKEILDCNSLHLQLLGAVYGEEKDALLREADFFVLPSYSEGFPTSVVEAMGHGCIPLISNGCNFPESFQAGLSIYVEPSEASIQTGLRQAISIDKESMRTRSKECQEFIKKNYFLNEIATQQATLYHGLLNPIKNQTERKIDS